MGARAGTTVARRRSRGEQLEAAATIVGVAVALFALSYDHGGYAVESRDLAGVLVWAAVLFGVPAGVWGERPLPRRAALVAGGALTALAGLAALSALWAASNERAFDDACRTLLYAGVFVVVVLSASRSGRGRWTDGAAIAITAVAAVALVSRFFPSVFGSSAVLRLGSSAVSRLSFPLGYWNGLAIFTALGVPMLFRAALAARHPLLRGLAIAPLPAFAALIYLTSSRGGALTALVGIFVFFALVGRRAATVAALAVVAPAAAIAVAVIRDRPEIANGASTAVAHRQGHEAALWIVVTCVAAAVAYAGFAAIGRRWRVARSLETALLAAGVVAAIVAVAAAHPVRRFDQFRRLPSTQSASSVESHLLSTSGTGRWQLWQAAVDESRTRPLIGRGAGSYEAWQTQHGTLGEFVQDAHSMYLQTLGELGVVGLVLFVTLLGVCIGAGAVELRAADDETNASVAALLAVAVAFAVALVFDWMWQLPAVAVVGVLALALLCARDSSDGAPAPRAGRRATNLRPWGAALALVAAVSVVALALPLLAQLQVDASRSRAAHGDLAGAVRHAVRARAITPWNATPYVQVALLAEQGHNYAAARTWIDAATRHDSSDWRLWLTAARIEAESGRVEAARRSLDRARALNPRLPLTRG